MLHLKVPTYAFHARRGHFLSHSLCSKLGGTNLHQSKLVFAALNLSTFNAQRCQLRTYLPSIANAASAGRPSRQHAPAIAKVVETLVPARSAALHNHDAILVRHPFSCFFIHIVVFCVSFTPLGLPKGSLFPQCQRSLQRVKSQACLSSSERLRFSSEAQRSLISGRLPWELVSFRRRKSTNLF